jgi:mannose-6-phosphate isomerase
MWYIMDAAENAGIYLGFRRDVTEAEIRTAIEKNTLTELLRFVPVHVGECYFIPGGLVHAIGEGTSVFEVQQSSNTTFRLYDWGRVDAKGMPRQLHVEEALSAMDLSLPPPVPGDSVDCAYFGFRKIAAGDVSAGDRRRVIYDCSADSLSTLEAGEEASFASSVFEVSLPTA